MNYANIYLYLKHIKINKYLCKYIISLTDVNYFYIQAVKNDDIWLFKQFNILLFEKFRIFVELYIIKNNCKKIFYYLLLSDVKFRDIDYLCVQLGRITILKAIYYKYGKFCIDVIDKAKEFNHKNIINFLIETKQIKEEKRKLNFIPFIQIIIGFLISLFISYGFKLY